MSILTKFFRRYLKWLFIAALDFFVAAITSEIIANGHVHMLMFMLLVLMLKGYVGMW